MAKEPGKSPRRRLMRFCGPIVIVVVTLSYLIIWLKTVLFTQASDMCWDTEDDVFEGIPCEQFECRWPGWGNVTGEWEMVLEDPFETGYKLYEHFSEHMDVNVSSSEAEKARYYELTVLFAHGNSGSYDNAATVGYYLNQYSGGKVRLLAIDGRHQISALYGSKLAAQARFLAHCAEMYQPDVLIGHSMGGAVSRSAIDRYGANVPLFIVLGSPVNGAVIYSSSHNYYSLTYFAARKGFSALTDVVTATGGVEDKTVAAHMTATSAENTLTGETVVGWSLDHIEIVYCEQWLLPLAAVMVDGAYEDARSYVAEVMRRTASSRDPIRFRYYVYYDQSVRYSIEYIAQGIACAILVSFASALLDDVDERAKTWRESPLLGRFFYHCSPYAHFLIPFRLGIFPVPEEVGLLVVGVVLAVLIGVSSPTVQLGKLFAYAFGCVLILGIGVLCLALNELVALGGHCAHKQVRRDRFAKAVAAGTGAASALGLILTAFNAAFWGYVWFLGLVFCIVLFPFELFAVRKQSAFDIVFTAGVAASLFIVTTEMHDARWTIQSDLYAAPNEAAWGFKLLALWTPLGLAPCYAIDVGAFAHPELIVSWFCLWGILFLGLFPSDTIFLATPLIGAVLGTARLLSPRPHADADDAAPAEESVEDGDEYEDARGADAIVSA